MNNSILVEEIFHGAKDEAKPAFSEQLAAGSNSDYGLQDSKQKEINLSAWVFKIQICLLLTAICLLVSLSVLAR